MNNLFSISPMCLINTANLELSEKTPLIQIHLHRQTNSRCSQCIFCRQRIKLWESVPDTNGLMLHLSIVLHALWPESGHCQSIVSPLGSPFQHPRFALYSVPTHCLARRCPHSQTGMTLGMLPAAQVEMSGRLSVWGSDKQTVPCQTKEVGRAGKACKGWIEAQ